MSKLRTKVNNNQEAQDKHDAYLEDGYKLESTRKTSNGLIVRTYTQ